MTSIYKDFHNVSEIQGICIYSIWLPRCLINCHYNSVLGTSPEDAYDEKLIHPLALKISLLFPGRPRKYIEDKFSRNIHESTNSEVMQAREEQKPCDFSKEPRYRATEFITPNGKSPVWQTPIWGYANVICGVLLLLLSAALYLNLP